jgi:hypothetical protein
MSIVWADSNITATALIDVIHGLTIYRVRYGKAWRAKEHTLTLFWGRLERSLHKNTKIVRAIAHFNLGTRCVIDTFCQWLPNETSQYYSALMRTFWCLPQCVANFTHCRPIISVDGTFLTGKYKGTVMVVVAMTVENQLLALAFVLVEGENNESWLWFLSLVRKQVLGPDR